MGLEAAHNPAKACTTSIVVLAESEREDAAGRKNYTNAHVLTVAQADEEEQVVKASITAKSYTVSGSSMGDLVVASFKAAYKDSLREALQRAEFNFVFTDPRLQDNPIVYASDGFLHMTGYTAEEVLGKNCRFLQGPATSRHAILEMRDAIREERSCQVAILNYTKQGTPFWNLLHMAPVYSKEDGRVVHFVGVQTPIASTSVQDCLPSAMDCFCTPASLNAPSPAGLCVHFPDVDPRQHSSPLDVDEDACEVKETHKDKAKSSVSFLMTELVSKCKGVGVTETRCTTVAAGPGRERVICSSLMLSLTKVQQSFVLVNPHLLDCPIVHASDMFLRLTGYGREEVVGHNCRFLQGPETDRRAVQLIGESLRAEKSCTVKLLNYRKDRRPFWNLLHIAPVRSSAGTVAFFVGVQLEASSVQEPCHGSETRPHMKQLGAVGAVRVAVRSLQGGGLRRVHKS